MKAKEKSMHGQSTLRQQPRALAALLFVALMSALLLASPPAPAADTPSAKAQSSQDKGAAATADTAADSVPGATQAEPEDTDATPSRGRRHRGMSVRIGSDHDDVEGFKRVMETAPWIVGVIFLVLGSIFLTPIVLLIGIVWYKLRKTRMQNEALLRLAETGAISPAVAVESVQTGEMPESAPPVAAKPGAAPYQQVVATRRRVIWTDLRKGLILGSIGLALVAYSVIQHGGVNWPGMVLLFVGAAYIVLWKLGDRHLDQAAGK
jgi:hypothetical protein